MNLPIETGGHRPDRSITAAVLANVQARAARVALGRLAAAGAAFHGNLLLDHARHQPRQGHGFLVRSAHPDRPGRLEGDLLERHDLVGFLAFLGDALAASDLEFLLAHFLLVHGHFAGDGPAFADALDAGDRAFHPDLARHPDLDGLGPGAAVVAAILLAALLDALPEGGAARNFPAFPVAAIDAALDHLGHGLAGDVLLHDGAFLDRGHAHADLAGFGADFRNMLVDDARARARFWNAFTTVGRVFLLSAFYLVDGAGALILFGHPFFHTDGAGTGDRRGTIAGPRGTSRCGRDDAGQQSDVSTLPDHTFSFVRN